MKYAFKKSDCKSIFLILLLAASGFSLKAQKNNPLINSGDILKQAGVLNDDGKYKEAIDLYKQISRSDTNYVEAVYGMSYSAYADSQYTASYQYSMQGLKLFPSQSNRFTMQAANALLDEPKGKGINDALGLYDQALAKDPQSAILYFNKGIGLIRDEKYNDAIKALQQCILINPYQYSAHYFLGFLYLKQGKLVPSMLALETYLMLAPNGKYNKTSVQLLSSISKVTDEVLALVKTKEASKGDKFDELQDILLSKAALDKHYKLKADLEDDIVRQIQVVNEKLEYNKNDKGFCMQYYVPIYQKLFAEGDFEPLIFNLFSGLEIKNVDNWNKHNKKASEAFAVKAVTYFNELRGSRKLILDERTNTTTKYWYENGKYIGTGSYRIDKEKAVFFGTWQFFYDNGNVKAKGNFDENEKKDGEWIYYYDNGQLKEKTIYKNGSEDGISEGWFQNGNVWYTESYIADKMNGVQTIYYYNGNLKTINIFSNDKKNGLQKNYSSNGELSSTINYVDDKQNGIARSYYAGGAVENQVTYKDDKSEGIYKSFSEKGTIIMQGEYENDLRQGLWTSYYDDGTIKDKTTYKDNEITGEFTEYYPDAKLSRKGTYVKKKVDGKVEEYDTDGKLYNDAIYDKGRLKEINFYDKSGAVLSNTTTRKGAANIAFYSPEGIKASECYYNKDGDKDGKNISYYSSGKVSSEIEYKDGEKDGNSKTYYPNGQIKQESNFTKGDEDGYSKEYHENGKLSYEGWEVKGKRQQHNIYYNLLGDVSLVENYLDNELNGYTEYKYPGNIPDCDYKYYRGWLESITQFDSTGKVIAENEFNQGKGPLIFYNYNGKKLAEGAYDHYMLSGAYKVYFCDGTLFSVGYYKNDKKDSIYKNYYLGGKLRSEGIYRNGSKDGRWKYYYENGKLSETEIYKDGGQTGVDTIYNTDGTYSKLINYKDNDKDGEYKIYGDNNQLAMIINYKNDNVQSYTYQDKSGQLVAAIPLKKHAGKVVAYYKNGVESIEMNFIDNDIQGLCKVFYTNGKVMQDGLREYGYDNGPIKMYYPDGSVWVDEAYVLGNLQGSRKEYYPNGKLSKDEFFYNGENHGICKYYDEQGKLKQTKVYYYGNLLSVK